MEPRILVADDEKEILNILADFMEEFGYRADFADTVDAALVLMQTSDYDIFLADKNMPDRDNNKEGGMRLLKYAKENMPGTEVIMITGYATIESAVEAMKLGAFDYITKPIPLKDLKEKIERILEYKRFINSENSVRIYKILHNQILDLLVNRENLPEDQIDKTLRTLGARIDQVFGMQKDYETIIETQAEALEKIEDYTEHLKETIPRDNPYYVLLEKIGEESRKRITL